MSRNRWAIMLLAVCSVLLAIAPADYLYYARAARAWLNGTSRLYDAQSQQFLYLPWTMGIIAPLSLLPDRLAQALLNTGSLVALVWSLRLGRVHNPLHIALALATPFVVVLVLLGQWDGLIVGAAVLGWYALRERRPWLLGIAAFILSTKPTNMVLVLVMWLVMLRTWRLRDVVMASVLPLVGVAASFLVFGADWIQRYIKFAQTYPPVGLNISLWADVPLWISIGLFIIASVGIGWLALRHNASYAVLAFALVAGTFLSRYVVPYHFVAFTPMLGLLVQHHFKAGISAWLATWLSFILFAANVPLMPVYFGALQLIIAGLFIKYYWRGSSTAGSTTDRAILEETS